MHAGAPRDSVPSPQSALHAAAQPSMRRLESDCVVAKPGGYSSRRAAGRARTRGPAPMRPAPPARLLLTRPPAHTAATGPGCRHPAHGLAEHRQPRALRWAPGRRRPARRGHARAPAAPRAGPPGRRPCPGECLGPPTAQPARGRRGRITHIATPQLQEQTSSRKHPHTTNACADASPHANTCSSFETLQTACDAPQHDLPARRLCCAHRKASGRPDAGEHHCTVLRLTHWHCASLHGGPVTRKPSFTADIHGDENHFLMQRRAHSSATSCHQRA